MVRKFLLKYFILQLYSCTRTAVERRTPTTQTRQWKKAGTQYRHKETLVWRWPLSSSPDQGLGQQARAILVPNSPPRPAQPLTAFPRRQVCQGSGSPGAQGSVPHCSCTRRHPTGQSLAAPSLGQNCCCCLCRGQWHWGHL